jgi:Tol biopolymer transport system component
VVEIRTTTLDGRSQVVHRGAPAAPVGWTPDSRTLAVVMSRPDRTWSVGTLPTEGGAFVPIRSFSWAFDPRNGVPRLSPDGRFIAFVEGDGGLRDIHVVRIDGSEAFRITDDPADDFAPVWSPDGRHLAFVSNRLGSVSLWSVEVRDGRPAGSVTKIKDGMQQSNRIVDWTAAGIVYDESSITLDLYTVAMDAKAERAIGEPRLLPYSRTGRNHSPAFSPDGQTLAFISSNAAEPNRKYVVVMPAGGGTAREFLIPVSVYEGDRSPYDLHWFGDGSGLGFSGLDSRRAIAVFRLRLSTGEWDTIQVPAKPWTRIEWNRDGSAFYYARQGVSDQSPAGVFERNVADDRERPVFRSPISLAAIRALELSPDRTRLAFQVRSFGAKSVENSSIVMVDLQSGDSRSVFNDTAGLTERRTASLLGWSPGGDLMVLRPRAGGESLDTLLVPPSGGEPRIFALPALPRSGAEPVMMDVKWSSAGGLLVIGNQRPRSETLVIENPLSPVAGAASRR